MLKRIKVPAIGVFFWITKILTTGMGETTSDWLVTHFVPVTGVIIAGIGLIVAFVFQFSAKKYIPSIYWFAVVMVSIFGTMAADLVHVVLGVPYLVSTIFFGIVLAVIFFVWHRTERTLSIHSITTVRRELFYWATVLTTFALGTATGDMTAATLHLGYFTSGVVFAIIILIPLVAYYWFGLSEILAFWFAYIVTRPLGASFADWMGVSTARSGLGWGTGPVSLALLILIIGFVGYLTLTHKEEEKRRLAS
ncbi:MAG: hypothetical protein JWM39_105 [Parcubacteria group bacterium]|nr:hypothetical protein [Parcubacteria group bacterium]